jgi:hypothetical protein
MMVLVSNAFAWDVSASVTANFGNPTDSYFYPGMGRSGDVYLGAYALVLSGTGQANASAIAMIAPSGSLGAYASADPENTEDSGSNSGHICVNSVSLTVSVSEQCSGSDMAFASVDIDWD